MDQPDSDLRLSRIATLWTDVHQAQLDGTLAPDARRKLLQIYGGAVRRYRADHPQVSSQEMAEGLSQALGKQLNAASVRQALHRARDRFADLLLDEIAHAVADPTPEALEEELVEIGLLEQCRPALE